MFQLAMDLMTFVLPGLIAAAGLFLVPGGDPWRARLQAIVWALAFVTGWMLLGRQPFPWAENGFFWSVLLLLVFICWSPKDVGLRYFVRAVFVFAVGVLVLWPKHAELGGMTHLRNLLAFFFLGLGVWSIVERSAQQVRVPSLVLLPLLSLIGLFWFLTRHHLGAGMFVGTVKLQLALLIGALIVTLVKPAKVSPAAVLPFVSVFVVALMACTHFYFHTNPWTMVFLCVPFVPLWCRGWLPFIPRAPLIEALGLGLLGALPIAYMFM
jgi:hypothetical protein